MVKQKPYDGVMVGLQQVPRTRSIQVYGVGEITPELLTLHFENFDGVGVADVKPHVDDDYAIVHLTDSTDKKSLCSIYLFICYEILLPDIELFIVTSSSHPRSGNKTF